jgi:hypothetical protein
MALLRCGRYQYTTLSSLITGSDSPALNAAMYGLDISSIARWSSPSFHLDEPSSVCGVL